MLTTMLAHVDAADLTATQFAVAMAIITLADPDGSTTAVLDGIAERAHASERRVRDAIAVLKALGLIAVERRHDARGHQQPSRYMFPPVDPPLRAKRPVVHQRQGDQR